MIEAIEGDIDDESDYFHPMIKVTDDIAIIFQCDIKSDYAYAPSLRYPGTKGAIEFNLPKDWWNYAFNKEVHLLVKRAIEEIIKLREVAHDISSMQDEIQMMTLEKYADKKRIESSLDKLSDVRQFLSHQL